MTAEELLKSVEGIVNDFKKESGDRNASEAITTLLSGLMVLCSEKDLEFEDFCDAADKRFDDLEAELSDESGEDLDGDDEDEDEDSDEDEEEEVIEEDEEEEEDEDEDEDEDNGNDDDFGDGDEEED